MLTIGRDIVAKIISHARADHPVMVCGVVAGPAGSDRPTRFIPMTNAERSPTQYRFDSIEAWRVWREMDERNEEPMIIYHSRHAADTYPSKADISYWSEPGAHLVIVSTRDSNEEDFHSFRIVDGKVDEEEVRILVSYKEAHYAQSYSQLDELSARLLRRAGLLEVDEEIDVKVAGLLVDDVDDFQKALAGLLGFPDVATLPGGGVRLSNAEVHEFAYWRLLQEEERAVVDGLRARVRRWRISKRGAEPRARLTRDYWTTKDQLGYRPYAEAIAAFIRHRETRPPLTIGIKGPWGAGKTSLMSDDPRGA